MILEFIQNEIELFFILHKYDGVTSGENREHTQIKRKKREIYQ